MYPDRGFTCYKTDGKCPSSLYQYSSPRSHNPSLNPGTREPPAQNEVHPDRTPPLRGSSQLSPDHILQRSSSSSSYLRCTSSHLLLPFQSTLTSPSQTPCLNSAASGVGCATADFACQCSSSASAAIVTAALGCVVSACGFATALEVSSSAAAICTACV